MGNHRQCFLYYWGIAIFLGNNFKIIVSVIDHAIAFAIAIIRLWTFLTLIGRQNGSHRASTWWWAQMKTTDRLVPDNCWMTVVPVFLKWAQDLNECSIIRWEESLRNEIFWENLSFNAILIWFRFSNKWWDQTTIVLFPKQYTVLFYYY